MSRIYRAYNPDQMHLLPASLEDWLSVGCVEVRSSRKIEEHLEEDVAFRVPGAGNTPLIRTVAAFRNRHLNEVAGLLSRWFWRPTGNRDFYLLSTSRLMT